MKKLLITLMFCIPMTSIAGKVRSKIEYLAVEDGVQSLGIVKFVSEFKGSPKCAENSSFAVNLDKTSGLEMYRILTAAHLAGREVHVWGTGNCYDHPGFESIEFIKVF